jgi:uncharacterized membrane protein
MATLTALKFHTPDGADAALSTVESLSKRELITVHDAAVVRWQAGKKKPKTTQVNSLAGVGALSGAFWGLLFGLLFFVPFFGAAVGAAMGALSGKFADVGIDDDFIRTVRDKVTPGTSALFLLTSNAVTDRVVDEMKQYDFELLSTNLSAEEEKALRDAFAED